jgi:CMP/dCMP kinase
MLGSNQSTKNGVIIAIDGPVASGKGTLAPRLAKRLKGFYLATGTMYRCVTLYAIQKDLLHDPAALVAALPHMRIRFRDGKVFLNEKDVTEQLIDNKISQKTPFVAIIPEVRSKLIELQQEIGKEYTESGINVIAEGRDIGTVVFPDAKIKLYLTANPAVRARRRLEQLHARGDTQSLYADVFQDTLKRDMYDQEEVKTLVKNPEEHGYKVIDSSALEEDETMDRILRFLNQQGIHYD